MSEIICDGTNYQGQDGVSVGITSFYKKLYSLNDSGPDRDQGFYDLCPEISQQSRFTMDAELTDAELLSALMTCSDSAPGSDGIPYSVYKSLWSIVGKYL